MATFSVDDYSLFRVPASARVSWFAIATQRLGQLSALSSFVVAVAPCRMPTHREECTQVCGPQASITFFESFRPSPVCSRTSLIAEIG